MNCELRADGLYIGGYVNVTGKMSKPVITSKGKVIEVIEERAFQRALEKVDNVPMTLDHNKERVLAQTSDNTLSLHEDAIGLHAEAHIVDPEIIESARQGKLKGWSFGMADIKDSIEERANELPLRHVKEFILDHITLVLNKNPVYSATSLELRAEDDNVTELELRACDNDVKVTDYDIKAKESIDYSNYENRINQLRSAN